MSLVALALRIVTVKVLTNTTLAGARVYDSAIDPVDQKTLAEAAPVIIIFTDDDTRQIVGRDLNNAERALDLVIEIACAKAVTITLPAQEGEEGEEVEAIEVPHTDAGLEVTINLIERQAMRALLTDQSVWGTLWRDIALAPERIVSRRGAGSQKGVRFAARQITLTTETLSEPRFGGPAEGFWSRFIAALEADADLGLQKLGALVRAEIETPSLPEWRRAIADLGVNQDTGDAIGIVPVYRPTEPMDEPIPVEGIMVDTDMPDDWPLDAQAAEDALGPAPDDD